MGVYEVAGELISGFQSNYEKSPPRPQALMSWRFLSLVSLARPEREEIVRQVNPLTGRFTK